MSLFGRRRSTTGLVLLGLGLGGCTDLQYYVPAQNCDAPELPQVTLTERIDSADYGTVPGVEKAVWLQIARQHGDGVIGGYLSPEPASNGGLVLLLCGAGTINASARVGAVLNFFQDYGQKYRDAGYRLWAPVLSEVDPYATGEVDDVVELLDWLNGPRGTLPDVERVFVVGYSSGATTANFVNLRGHATAVVSLAGLTEPNQLMRQEAFYRTVTDLFPCNTGMNQMHRTLDYYKTNGWDNFSVVNRVVEMKNPALFMTAGDDIVFEPANVHDLEQAYDAALADGAIIPQLTFDYLQRGDHFAYVTESEPLATVLNYLQQFEPQ